MLSLEQVSHLLELTQGNQDKGWEIKMPVTCMKTEAIKLESCGICNNPAAEENPFILEFKSS